MLGAVGKEFMSYRELSMIDVKELLRRWSAGQSNRQIATETGAARGTVGRYVTVVEEYAIEQGHEFAEAFDAPLWVDEATVHPDHHIHLAHVLYSVPTLYLRKKVRVRADKKLIKIYFGTELIKVHPRKPPGGRSTDINDYPAGKAAYTLRSVDGLLAKAKQKGGDIGTYAERILAGPLPWARMRQAYALLRLCDKYGQGRVEAMCQTALAFDVVDVTRITRMLKSASKPQPQASSRRGGNLVQLALPRFVHPEKHFETHRSGKDSTKKEGV